MSSLSSYYDIRSTTIIVVVWLEILAGIGNGAADASDPVTGPTLAEEGGE
jgi:hypothetical protein